MDEPTQRIEIYKKCVDTLAAIRDRRHRASAVHLGMFVVVGNMVGSIGQSSPLFLIELACLVSLSWYWTMRGSWRMEEAHVSVIEEIEQDMSLTAFRNLRKRFRQTYQRGHTLAQMEMVVPIALLTCSLVVLVIIGTVVFLESM